MNWEKETVEDLRRHKSEKESLENLKIRIASVEARMRAAKCSCSDSVPVQGGMSKTEEHLINNIVERDKLLYTYQFVKARVKLVERVLNSLSQEDREVLLMMYVDRRPDCIDRLCERLHCERSSVYRIRDRALRNFTRRMYGIREI